LIVEAVALRRRGERSNADPLRSPATDQRCSPNRYRHAFELSAHSSLGLVKRYTDDPAQEMLPASPDGKMILFARLRSDFNFDIYSVSVENVHDVRPVLSDSAAENAPDVAATRPCTGICPP
jgi:hypothetical protein